MLYDPNWEVKTDPYSLDSLIAWLETKPSAENYDFYNCKGRCLIGQYMAHHGCAWNGPNYDKFCEALSPSGSLWDVGFATSRPYTFGAALKRARAAKRSR